MEDVGILAYGIPFYFEAPADWEGQIDPQGTYTRAVLSGASAAVEIYIALLEDGRSLGEYVEADIEAQAQQVAEFNFLMRETLVNARGLSLEVITAYQNPGRPVTSRRMYYLHDDAVIFAITYFTFTEEFTKFEPLIAYSFNTFDIGD